MRSIDLRSLAFRDVASCPQRGRPSVSRRLYALLRASFASASLPRLAPAHADSWANPVVREIFSASRDHFVRVTPGTSIGDTIGFAGAAKGAYASAEYYRRQADRSYRLMATATLLNPVAPVDIVRVERRAAGDGR